MFHYFGRLTFAYLALHAVGCVALQNIRIQVNNENLQNPPYLLEALKQASAHESNTQAQKITETANEPSVGAPTGNRLQASARAPASQDSVRPVDVDEGSNNEKMGPIKEETIEELLDLQPESVLRLSPEGIIGSVSEQGNLNNAAAGSETIAQHVSQPPSTNNQETRKPQLPVTSSHLKRPAISAEQLDQPLSVESRSNLTDESGLGGARSRVSPSVLADDGPAVDLGKKRAVPGVQPPDTLEPNQVMNGVTNSLLVPATVRRQYGHHTRTRITLGGGYERDKLPPLVEPSSSVYQEKPAAEPPMPLERPDSNHEHHVESESSNVDAANDYDQSRIVENSRLVEVPKRIVVPVSVLNTDEEPAKPRPVNVTRRRDSRCPANGVTSLEHPTACDKYFLCQDGQLSEHTCPNGLLYGTRDVVRDFCVHRWDAVCGDKSIPNPISSPGCRWQNGIFSVQGSPKCVPDFYECKDGQFEVRKCSIGGQVYDDRTKTCRYAEQVGCTQEALADFRCPADDQANTYWPFPRYFLNERALIHCVNDKPEIIRCRDHERVDPEHLFCVPNKSDAPAGDETAGTPEITARRSLSVNQQREKATKPAESPPSGVVAAN